MTDNESAESARLVACGLSAEALRGADAQASDTLVTLLEQAFDDQQVALDQAMDDALGIVPRLLRGPVKKLFGA